MSTCISTQGEVGMPGPLLPTSSSTQGEVCLVPSSLPPPPLPCPPPLPQHAATPAGTVITCRGLLLPPPPPPSEHVLLWHSPPSLPPSSPSSSNHNHFLIMPHPHHSSTYSYLYHLPSFPLPHQYTATPVGAIIMAAIALNSTAIQVSWTYSGVIAQLSGYVVPLTPSSR